MCVYLNKYSIGDRTGVRNYNYNYNNTQDRKYTGWCVSECMESLRYVTDEILTHHIKYNERLFKTDLAKYPPPEELPWRHVYLIPKVRRSKPIWDISDVDALREMMDLLRGVRPTVINLQGELDEDFLMETYEKDVEAEHLRLMKGMNDRKIKERLEKERLAKMDSLDSELATLGDNIVKLQKELAAIAKKKNEAKQDASKLIEETNIRNKQWLLKEKERLDAVEKEREESESRAVLEAQNVKQAIDEAEKSRSEGLEKILETVMKGGQELTEEMKNVQDAFQKGQKVLDEKVLGIDETIKKHRNAIQNSIREGNELRKSINSVNIDMVKHRQKLVEELDRNHKDVATKLNALMEREREDLAKKSEELRLENEKTQTLIEEELRKLSETLTDDQRREILDSEAEREEREKMKQDRLIKAMQSKLEQDIKKIEDEAAVVRKKLEKQSSEYLKDKEKEMEKLEEKEDQLRRTIGEKQKEVKVLDGEKNKLGAELLELSKQYQSTMERLYLKEEAIKEEKHKADEALRANAARESEERERRMMEAERVRKEKQEEEKRVKQAAIEAQRRENEAMEARELAAREAEERRLAELEAEEVKTNIGLFIATIREESVKYKNELFASIEDDDFQQMSGTGYPSILAKMEQYVGGILEVGWEMVDIVIHDEVDTCRTGMEISLVGLLDQPMSISDAQGVVDKDKQHVLEKIRDDIGVNDSSILNQLIDPKSYYVSKLVTRIIDLCKIHVDLSLVILNLFSEITFLKKNVGVNIHEAYDGASHLDPPKQKYRFMILLNIATMHMVYLLELQKACVLRLRHLMIRYSCCLEFFGKRNSSKKSILTLANVIHDNPMDKIDRTSIVRAMKDKCLALIKAKKDEEVNGGEDWQVYLDEKIKGYAQDTYLVDENMVWLLHSQDTETGTYKLDEDALQTVVDYLNLVLFKKPTNTHDLSKQVDLTSWNLSSEMIKLRDDGPNYVVGEIQLTLLVDYVYNVPVEWENGPLSIKDQLMVEILQAMSRSVNSLVRVGVSNYISRRIPHQAVSWDVWAYAILYESYFWNRDDLGRENMVVKLSMVRFDREIAKDPSSYVIGVIRKLLRYMMDLKRKILDGAESFLSTDVFDHDPFAMSMDGGVNEVSFRSDISEVVQWISYIYPKLRMILEMILDYPPKKINDGLKDIYKNREAIKEILDLIGQFDFTKD